MSLRNLHRKHHRQSALSVLRDFLEYCTQWSLPWSYPIGLPIYHWVTEWITPKCCTFHFICVHGPKSKLLRPSSCFIEKFSCTYPPSPDPTDSLILWQSVIKHKLWHWAYPWRLVLLNVDHCPPAVGSEPLVVVVTPETKLYWPQQWR